MKMNEESVFTEALAKGDPQERANFLDQACAGDPALRDSVDSLLDPTVRVTPTNATMTAKAD